jgi:Flp pilus assembly protein TadG
MTRKCSSLRHAENGEVAVEGAVTMLALVFLILGSVQFGLVFWNWNTMMLAVEEAGRYVLLYDNQTNYPNCWAGVSCPNCSASPATPANCAVAWANQNWGNNFTITPNNADPNCPGITFTAQYPFTFINSISLSRGICVPVL